MFRHQVPFSSHTHHTPSGHQCPFYDPPATNLKQEVCNADQRLYPYDDKSWRHQGYILRRSRCRYISGPTATGTTNSQRLQSQSREKTDADERHLRQWRHQCAPNQVNQVIRHPRTTFGAVIVNVNKSSVSTDARAFTPTYLLGVDLFNSKRTVEDWEPKRL